MDDIFTLLEYQFAPKNLTREDIAQRLITAGGEERTVDGERRIYVYRIAWRIAGYNPDKRMLIDHKLTYEEAKSLEDATVPIYYSVASESFVFPPEGKVSAELVDDTLKITADLKMIREEKQN